MKKTYLLSLLLGLVAVPALQAIEVKTAPGFGPWKTGSGGEFTLQIISGLNNDSYAPSTKDQSVPPSFQTFCVEFGEGIEANKNYFGALGNTTVASGKPLSVGVAWLYSEFAKGSLLGYDFANSVDRKASAALLQHTIWALMGEGGQVNNGSLFDLAVINQFGSWANAQVVAGANNYGVNILTLTEVVIDTQGQRTIRNRQDMLWYNTPDGGLTIMLLGMGLSGLAFMSRRIRG